MQGKVHNMILSDVIVYPIFIPFDSQIYHPTLHISLDCYLKFFSMLENDCHHLDLKIAGKIAIKNHDLEEKDFKYFVRNNRTI